MKCNYGCGLDAIHQFKNGNYCCSENVNKCPAKRKKDSESKKGHIPLFLKNKTEPHRPRLGKEPPNKGKSYEESYGSERAKEIREKMSAALRGRCSGLGQTAEKEKERCQKISESINKRYAAGWLPKAGRCKKIEYNSQIAGKIMVDGTWELKTAQSLDEWAFYWQRNKNRFIYYFDGKYRFYTPDFFIKDLECYIEVKGYATEKDRAKWLYFPHKLIVLRKNEIYGMKNGTFGKKELINMA